MLPLTGHEPLVFEGWSRELRQFPGRRVRQHAELTLLVQGDQARFTIRMVRNEAGTALLFDHRNLVMVRAAAVANTSISSRYW